MMFQIYKINIQKKDGIDFFDTKIFTKSIDDVRRKIKYRPEYYYEDIRIDIRYVLWLDGTPESFNINHIERVDNKGAIGLNYITKKIKL